MAFRRVSRAPVPVESPEVLFRDLRNRRVKGLLAHQADILRDYVEQSVEAPDVALQLPTGSGKTLVGLLIGEWRRRQHGQRVAYLCPTRQLANQVASQSTDYGIKAVALVGPQADFSPAARSAYLDADAVAVTTYSAIFNTNPFFEGAGTLVCDDAHAAENYVAAFWSLLIRRPDHPVLFDAFVGCVKESVSAGAYSRLRSEAQQPWDRRWVEKLPTPVLAARCPEVIALLDEHVPDVSLRYAWSVLRENLSACHVYFGPQAILIRPFIPPTQTHEPFSSPAQRVYMSATLGQGGDLERLWGRAPIQKLAAKGWDRQGVGRRLFFFPERSLREDETTDVVTGMIKETPRVLVLAPDNRRATALQARIVTPTGYQVFDARQIEESKQPFVETDRAAAVVANRYDGIDLVEDECRLLVVSGLPQAVNLQEAFLANRLGATVLLTDRILTRVTQGIGRCTRSPTDYAAVVVMEDSLVNFLLRPENRPLFHPEIQAEVTFGLEQSKDTVAGEFIDNLRIFLRHDDEWNQIDEQQLVPLREACEQQGLPAAAQLGRAVSREVAYQYRMWSGDYQGAVEEGRRVLTELSGDIVAPYRAFWNYLVGSAAWLAYRSGVASMAGVAQEHFRNACAAAPAVGWLVDAARTATDTPTPVSDDDALRAVIESLEAQLESLGVATARGFDEVERFILENLGRSEAKPFERGHLRLGQVLGYEAGNSDATAAPDPWWAVGDRLCVVFEDHSDSSSANPIGASKVRQAASHPAWIRANLPLAADARVVPVLISACETLDAAAAPYADEVCYWNLERFRQWAREALAVVRDLWTKFPGQADLAWRAAAMTAYQNAGLDPRSLVTRIEESRLRNLTTT